MSLEHLIDDISVRVRLIKAAQEAKEDFEFPEREILLLELLEAKGKMSITELAEAYPIVGTSIISSTISKLWKKKIVAKEKDANNQRITYVSLTKKGEQVLCEVKNNKSERYKILIEALNLDSNQQVILEEILLKAIGFLDTKLGLRKKHRFC